MRHDRPERSTDFDPPIRKRDDGRTIHICIDLPGITEEQIRIDLEKTMFTVSVSEETKTRKKVIRVPDGTRFFKKKFSDGILEIVLERPAA